MARWLGWMVSLAWLLSAEAQGLPPLRRFEPIEYQGERQIWDIAQAPDGTIAVANGAGLLTFDGVRWNTHPVPGSQVLRTVIYHPQAHAWLAGGYDGWWRWQILSGQLSPPQRIAPPSEPKEEWWHTLLDPQDSSMLLWQSFSRIAKMTHSGQYTLLPTPGNILFAKEVRDTLLLPVLKKGLYFLDQQGHWQLYPRGQSFIEEEIVGLAPTHAAGLLVATRSGTISKIVGNRIEAWPLEATPPWQKSALNGLLALQDGSFAVATAGDGLYLLDADGRQKAHLTSRNGLGDGAVLSLFQSQDGGLWVGLNDGLAYLSLNSGILTYAAELGAVYDVDSREKGWLVATNHGLFSLNKEGVTQPIPGLNGQIWHLSQSSGGLVLGDNEGTYQLDDRLAVTKISTLPGGWSWLNLDSTHALAGSYTGIEAYQLEGQRWVSRGRVQGLDGPVQQLLRDPELATQLYAVHPQEGLSSLKMDEDFRQVLSKTVLDSLPGHLILDASGRKYYRDRQFVFKPFGKTQYKLSAGRLDLVSPQGDFKQHELDINLDYPVLRVLDSQRVAIGLNHGFAVLEPQAAKLSASPAPVQISTAQSDNIFELKFSQLRFASEPLFRVKLLGIDTSFSAWSGQGEYTFPLLRAGRYRLLWQANDGQSGQLEWVVPDPWYLGLRGLALYALLIAAGFWGLRSYYRKRLHVQQRQADIDRERQLQAERMRARNSRLEDQVRVSRREVELSHLELAFRQNELEQRNRELAQSTLAQARYNESLLQIREGIEILPKTGDVGKVRRQLFHVLEAQLGSEEDWLRFMEHFDAVHVGFLYRLHEVYPELTPGDLRLAALLRMNLASKEIAPLLHLSIRGVENKRYRLRKKLGLEADDNLTEWVLSF